MFILNLDEFLLLKGHQPRSHTNERDPNGVLTVLTDDGAPPSHQTVNNIAVVLQETIVLEDIPDLPTVFAYLFGLLYALNMEFQRHLRCTFETEKHIFMELTRSCSQSVWSLKTKLLL